MGFEPTSQPIDPHFVIRARERGFADEAPFLYSDLRLALLRLFQGIDADGDYVEAMFPVRGSSNTTLTMFRFCTRAGVIGYALASGTRPVTLCTREMVDHYRAKRAAEAKGKPKARPRGVYRAGKWHT